MNKPLTRLQLPSWGENLLDVWDCSHLYGETGENFPSNGTTQLSSYPFLWKNRLVRWEVKWRRSFSLGILTNKQTNKQSTISFRSLMLVWRTKWYSDILIIPVKREKRTTSEGIPLFRKLSREKDHSIWSMKMESTLGKARDIPRPSPSLLSSQ